MLLMGCRGSVPRDEAAAAGTKINREAAAARFPPAERDYFTGMDGTSAPGIGPRIELTPEEIRGRNAWMMWTGGNEAFWDWLSRHGFGTIDLLKLIDSARRGDRFERAGLITEPGMRPPTDEETAASYGVRYDRPRQPSPEYGPDPAVYGYSSGVVGLRLYPNPEFKGAAVVRWDAGRYYSDYRFATDPGTIRPYRVGMSCAFCHVSPDPLRPPTDPESPEWQNLSGTIGNQYLRVREVLGNTLEKHNLLYHVIDSQMPGTIDTSLIASDNINNANTFNAVFGLAWRVERSLHNPLERLDSATESYPGLWETKRPGTTYAEFDANPRAVPRVLVDGSDSVGAWIAMARVYLNIGTFHEQWIRLHNPILGFRKQDPFKLADIEANSVYWHATKLRTDPMLAFFLKATDPMRLRDAPEGMVAGKLKGTGLPWDANYPGGRAVFAMGCIACHSSIQPGDRASLEEKLTLDGIEPGLESRKALRLQLSDLARLTRGDGQLPDAYARWAKAAVEQEEFWKENYLSTDMRIPVTLVQTNSARAVGTNATHGRIWEDFSSMTYKELPAVGRISYFDPVSGANKDYSPPSGGTGYYRVPTLISTWATAPYFHNNALGQFNNDPSVRGRLLAYEDGLTKLLWPERRMRHHDHGTAEESDDLSSKELEADHGLIWRTSQPTSFNIFGHQVPGLLAGVTGWSRWSVRLFPWIPALTFLAIGLWLLLHKQASTLADRIKAKGPRAATLLAVVHFLAILASLAVAAVLTWLAYRYWFAFRVVEQTSEWVLPWITLQVILIIVFFVIAGLLMAYDWWTGQRIVRRLSIYLGSACLFAACLFAIGIGAFGSGRGGDFKLGPFPKGMPVNLLANIDPAALPKDVVRALQVMFAYFRDVRSASNEQEPGLHEFEQRVAPLLMKISKCPDFVLDRGHDYESIRRLSDQEKRDLMELIKTF
jgi:hypothetical protein